PENVVNGQMGKRGAVVQAMAYVGRHGLGVGQKNGRLVHVVPEAGDTHVQKIPVQAAPPFARARQCEISKHAVAGPDRSDIRCPVRAFEEDVVLDARVIGHVTVIGVLLDVEVGDQYGVNALCGQVRDHFFKGREFAAIDGERSVFVLVVDVEVDGVDRNL